jgi:hypothetical protein
MVQLSDVVTGIANDTRYNTKKGLRIIIKV